MSEIYFLPYPSNATAKHPYKVNDTCKEKKKRERRGDKAQKRRLPGARYTASLFIPVAGITLDKL